MKCVVCDDRPRVGILLCAECAGAFDRWAPISDETEASVIAWAARRTRRAERRRLKAVVEDLAKMTRERDAYRRAKQQNDERYMIERDEAREEARRLGLENELLRAELAMYVGGTK